MKQNGSAVRVLMVQDEGLGHPPLDRILGPAQTHLVRARSVPEARELLRSQSFDLIVADDSRVRGVLDALYAFVGLFSLGGMVLDCNEAPLSGSGLARDQVIGHRFVDLPWFAHSEPEQASISAAIGAAARGESVRLETQVQSTPGVLIWVDAAFLPLRDQAGVVTHVVGSGVDITARKQAQNALKQAVSALSATLEATADGILVGDRNGKVAAVNGRFLAMWRLPSDVGPGTDIRTLAESVRGQLVDPDAFMATVSELYGDEHKEGFDVIRFKDGRVLERYSLPQEVGGAIIGRVCSFRDVTQRERLLQQAKAERAAAETARRDLEAVLDRVSDGFVALDRSWRCTYVNTCGARLMGRDAGSMVGKHLWTEFPETDRQKFQLAHDEAMREQRPIQIRDKYPPWNRWFESRIYPSEDGSSIFFRDITDQVMMEDALQSSNDQLRALAARLDSVREEERQVIAREIHDQIGQALTALKLDLGWLRNQLRGHGDPGLVKRAAAMDGLVEQILETARRVSAELRPAILDDLGLAAAIGWQARDLEQRTGIACDVHLPSDAPPIAPDVALALFRIVQEALTNVVRHAAARRVRIDLTVKGDTALLSIADDGRGATAEELQRPAALGVLGMRERALVVGGTVAITGSTGHGTTVTVIVPLPGRVST